MLIKCPECQKKISDRAHHCVYCGFPLNEYLEEERMKSPEVAPYVCKINGKMRDVKWILDILNGYTEKELDFFKKLAGSIVDDDRHIPQNKWEDTLDDELWDLIDKIIDHLDLASTPACGFIYEILDNEKKVPKEFNGQTYTEYLSLIHI